MDTSLDTTKAGKNIRVVNLSSVKEGTLDHLVAASQGSLMMNVAR